MLNRHHINILIRVLLLFFVVFLILFVFLIDYSDENFFKICRVIIYRDGVYLFVALVTVLSVLVAYSQWQFELNFKRKSDINGLLEELRHNVNIIGGLLVNDNAEELRHNVNIIDGLFVNYKARVFYPFIFKEIDKMGNNKIYPNPSDLPDIKEQFYKVISFSNRSADSNLLMPLRSNFIDNAISSKNIFALSNNRIFLNLGHLSYSIRRHNIYINNFNSDPNQKEYEKIKEQYALWLHFRLHFMLADLISNTKSKYFIDKEYVNNIKEYKKKQHNPAMNPE